MAHVRLTGDGSPGYFGNAVNSVLRAGVYGRDSSSAGFNARPSVLKEDGQEADRLRSFEYDQ